MSAPGSWVENVGEEEFESRVLERSHDVPVVVDFWAEWCGPCRLLGPTLEKLADEYAGRFVLAKVDTDKAPLVSRAYGVRGIPAVMGFRRAEVVAEFTGALPEEAVRNFLDKICPSEAERLFEQAEEKRKVEAVGAEAHYRQVLELDPRHEGARVAIAELRLERGDRDGASAYAEGLEPVGAFGERIAHVRSELALQELVPEDLDEGELRGKLDENPNDGPVWVQFGKLLASRGRYQEALQALLTAAESDRGLAQGEVKELMVEIFHAVGVRSEIADEYRTKLSRLLY